MSPPEHSDQRALESTLGNMDWAYQPRLPRKRDMGIGIVGAGDIVRSCHLPAYRMAGFRIVGVYDRDRAKSEALAREFGIENVFDSLERLASHSEIAIADVAVPAAFQAEVISQLVPYRLHILCQKPLAECYSDALDIAAMCSRAGVKAAVNQQMRWAPGIQASRTAVKRGWIGAPYQGAIQVHVNTPWETWEWLAQADRLEVMYHSIHYLDAIRYVLGSSPKAIFADGASYPGATAVRGETRTTIQMLYEDDTRGLVYDNHTNFIEQSDWFATFRFDGTEGVVKGTNGALYNYPVGQEDTVALYSKNLQPRGWYAPKLEGRWFPHAFMGTMGELMRAIEEEREPENSVEDNLITMQTVFAAYRSMELGRIVALEEIG